MKLDQDIQDTIRSLLDQEIDLNMTIEMPFIKQLQYRIDKITINYEDANYMEFNMIPDNFTKSVKILTPKFKLFNVTL